MLVISDRARAVHSDSAERLARAALGALLGTESGCVVARHLLAAAQSDEFAGGRPASPASATSVAATAVRMLGANVLAPYALTGRALPPEESEAVRAVLPVARPAGLSPPTAGERERSWELRWVDWGLACVLHHLDPAAPGPDRTTPPGPPRCDAGAPRRVDAGPGAEGRSEGWVPWSLRMGRVASLALPCLDGPVHHAARRNALPLARGATRALLRGDYSTAARITRWLAWLAADGVPPCLDVDLLTQDIALRGGGRRCLLDVALARQLLDLEIG
ncbi:hypothetical protein [Streptomyces sp. NPDC005876]|uniref:hypothetical protein n=1 Tax=unclassified Streptomyces TaxID=2593676 RepID=UPI0033C8509A